MDKETRRQRLFELFNEIGIIEQLATSEFNRRLPDGLHVSHFAVINHMCRLGDGDTPAKIAQAFQVTKPTMTNTLAKLSARGFIDVRDNPKDGRSKLVYLTDQGRAFQSEAIEMLYPACWTQLVHEARCRQSVLEVVPALRELRTHTWMKTAAADGLFRSYSPTSHAVSCDWCGGRTVCLDDAQHSTTRSASAMTRRGGPTRYLAERLAEPSEASPGCTLCRCRLRDGQLHAGAGRTWCAHNRL